MIKNNSISYIVIFLLIILIIFLITIKSKVVMADSYITSNTNFDKLNHENQNTQKNEEQPLITFQLKNGRFGSTGKIALLK